MSLAQAARVGDAVSAIDTPGAGDRPRRDGAQHRAHGGLSRARTACDCARTPRCTRAPPSRKLQIAAGAVGVCVQKLSEAEALAGAGVGDIYISNEVIDAAKLAALAALAGRVKLSLAVDSALGVDRLARRR